MTLKLLEPSIELKEAFQSLVWDYIRHKDTYFMGKYKDALNDYEAYIKTLQGYAKGINIEEDWVPFSTFWLVNDSEEGIEVLGNIRIRHQRVDYAGHLGYDIKPSARGKGFGHEILKLGLKKAHTFGIDDVYLTVNRMNESSQHIIESAGGIYTRSFIEEDINEERLEYIIHNE